jgi:hypothetical protein
MDRMRRRGKSRAGNAYAAKTAEAHRATSTSAAHRPGRVVKLTITPERMLERASRKFLPGPCERCVKCGSTFVMHEPAFIHCHYCGNMARIANASLGAQELYELVMGLRLAS